MSTTYLIPQFIVDYLQNSRSTKNPKSLVGPKLKKFKTPEIEKWFKENEVTTSYIWKFFVFYGLNKFSFRECSECKKRLSMSQMVKGYKYCSVKCSNSSKEKKEKQKQTNLEKYGVENPLQSKEIQEKAKETCFKKYGTEYATQSEIVKTKVKKTNFEKYGVENPFQSEVCKEKSKQTCLEKYGVEHPTQTKIVQEKRKQSCVERYGVENPIQSEKIKEKIKQTNIERYDADFPLKSKEIQEKIKETCLEKYGVENPNQSKKVRYKTKQTRRSNCWEIFCSRLKEKDIIPLFSKEDYVAEKGRKFKCLSCGVEFTSEGTCEFLKEHKRKDGTYIILRTQNIFCPHCFKAPTSKKEKEVLEFVKSIYSGEILENHKGLFPSNPRMELDIYLPNLNLGIEFDGDYWHSKEGAKEKDERKNQLCEEKGIKLLRIKESDWGNNPDKVKEEIKYFLINRDSE